jgi:hypothetical protein
MARSLLDRFRVRNGLARIVALSASVVAACSGADKADSAMSTSMSTSGDGVVVDASADTRATIGVASWGIRNDGTSTIVKGYDPQRSPIVTFEYRVSRAPATTTIDAALDARTRHPTLRIEMRDSAQATAVHDSLAGDDDSKAVLARMVADLRSGIANPATTTTTTTTSTTTTSIRPLDAPLVDNEPRPLIECDQLVTNAAANAGQTTTDCGDDPGSPACNQGVAEAPRDQDKVKQCKDHRCTDSPPSSGNGLAARREALTGPGTSSLQWHVNGTDLGIPFALGKGTTGFLFGDTFDAPGVGGPGWRSPVLLLSMDRPSDGISFSGSGFAPQIVDSAHSGCGGEFTIIPNDGVRLPDGRTIVSFMSVRDWAGLCPDVYPGQWRTNYAGLASATTTSTATGDHFTRAPIQFGNDLGNLDPFQMQTMQYDDVSGYVYFYSVRAGRQVGPMMLQRVTSKDILDKGSYECWSSSGNGGNAGTWGKSCSSVLPETDFGEPSVRKLDNCVWAMSYLAGGRIVTRTASKPEGPWTDEHVQVTAAEQPCLYGGFIHPSSTASDLHLMVSAWGDSNATCGHGAKYGVDHFSGSL